MGFAIAAIVGLAFGAADQFLGSRAALGGWASAVSQLSAPWLVLPFLAGSTQARTRKAMLIGLVATVAALIGYFAMTYSPFEGFPVRRLLPGMFLMMRTGYNPLWIAGGVVSGPLFGLLGQRWRTARWWVSGAVVTLVLCLEPPARGAIGWLPSTRWPSLVEVTVGLVAAVTFIVVGWHWRRTALDQPGAGGMTG